MAKPFGPKTARSLVTEPPPDVREQAAGSDAVRSSSTPRDEPLPARRPRKPWPTTDSPYTKTIGANFLPAPVTDWEEPPAPTDSLNGGSNGEKHPPITESPAFEWEQTPPAQEQETGMDLADSSPLYPGRRPLYKRPDAPPSAEAQLANVITFLQKLQSNIRDAVPEAEEPSPTALGSTLLQLRRLSRTGVAPDHFEIGVLPKPPKVEIAPPVEADSEPVVEETVEPTGILSPVVPTRPARRSAVWLVLPGVCVVVLGLAAYLWTRPWPVPQVDAVPRNRVARGTPSPTPEQEISPEALNLANLALEAMQRGDFKQVSDVLASAQKDRVVLPGLYYQAALLAFNQGQNQEADDFLERSIAAKEAVSDCWYLRANTIFYNLGPAQAAEAFEPAVASSPFSPRYHFFRAECLRRNGNAVAAVGQFQQALRCRPSSSDTELILFKIGLTKIETNTDLIFKTELHDRLAHEPVSGDTLLLLAADAISRNEFAEAAGFLKRAALVLPPRAFQSRIRDYVFQAQAKQPDIAAVLQQTPLATTPNGQSAPRSGRTLVDPAMRSLSEADPAGW